MKKKKLHSRFLCMYIIILTVAKYTDRLSSIGDSNKIENDIGDLRCGISNRIRAKLFVTVPYNDRPFCNRKSL